MWNARRHRVTPQDQVGERGAPQSEGREVVASSHRGRLRAGDTAGNKGQHNEDDEGNTTRTTRGNTTRRRGAMRRVARDEQVGYM